MSPSPSVLKHKGNLEFVWFVLRVNVLNSEVNSLDSSICAWESQTVIFEKYSSSVSINTSERLPKSFDVLDIQRDRDV